MQNFIDYNPTVNVTCSPLRDSMKLTTEQKDETQYGQHDSRQECDELLLEIESPKKTSNDKLRVHKSPDMPERNCVKGKYYRNLQEMLKLEPVDEEQYNKQHDSKQEGDELLLEIESPKNTSNDKFLIPKSRHMPERKCVKVLVSDEKQLYEDVEEAKDDQDYKHQDPRLNDCYKLNRKEENWLIQETTSSRMRKDLYCCTQCNKCHFSYASIRYHFLMKHIKNAREWIKCKVKKAHQTNNLTDGSKAINHRWECDQCNKCFSSAPAIRYHLSRHLLS